MRYERKACAGISRTAVRQPGGASGSQKKMGMAADHLWDPFLSVVSLVRVEPGAGAGRWASLLRVVNNSQLSGLGRPGSSCAGSGSLASMNVFSF